MNNKLAMFSRCLVVYGMLNLTPVQCLCDVNGGRTIRV